MELNKNSKWIKFYLRFNLNKPTNFCDYFWGSLKSIIIALISLIMTIVLIICLLSPIMLLWKDFDQRSVLSNIQIVGILTGFIILITLIFYKIIKYRNNQLYIFKKDSTIKIWYEDFKNKHCTLITWK